jgi:small subunit ribosomal protein S17
MPKRILQGMVVSDKGDKTVVVRVDRRVTHPVYKKIITRSKKFMAHDEENLYRIGDTIRIEESRPLSKRKRWVAVERVARGVASREDTVEAEAQAIMAEAAGSEGPEESEGTGASA